MVKREEKRKEKKKREEKREQKFYRSTTLPTADKRPKNKRPPAKNQDVVNCIIYDPLILDLDCQIKMSEKTTEKQKLIIIFILQSD